VVNDVGGTVDGSGNDITPARQVIDEIRAAGGTAIANGDDISDWEGAQRVVKQALDEFGGLDVVVNNAGILRDRMLVNMTESEWDAVIKVHLKGTFATSRWAAVYWRDRAKAGHTNDARIINTTSISGLYANPGQTNYGAAKAGIAAICVNAIAPGALTRMTEDLIDEKSKASFAPRWVAPVCTWLASPLSAGVTGEVIEASGRVLAIAEGWRRGPKSAPIDDPAELDSVLRRLIAEASPRTTMGNV
jgi:NAD(P)-dependent dehydrogenase (short-subunit alcohol dehydrogenase family)